MKLSCTQENLNHGLGLVNHITPKSHHLPILNNVFLIASNSQLEVKATNLEIGIQTNIRAKVDIEGSFTVNGKLFCDLVSLLPQDKVELELSQNQLIVVSGQSVTKINGLPPEDFPVLPSISNKLSAFVIKMIDLKEAIPQVIISASQDESRPELCGVLWWFKQGNLILTTTDSYRLSEKNITPKDSKSLREDQVIVPLRTTQEVLRVFGDEEEIEVLVGENQIMFKSEVTELVSRIIDGKYPDYQQIIPTSPILKVVIKKEELIRAIKMAGLFTKMGLNHIDVSFNKSAGLVDMLSSTSQLGESKLSVGATLEGGDVETTTFDWRFLLAGIESIPGQDVIIHLTSSQAPALLKGQDETQLYLLMPIRK